MTKFKDLLKTAVSEYGDAAEGYKKYARAKFSFTRERAEEFSQISIEDLMDDPYFLGMKWNGRFGIWPRNKDIVLQLYEEREKRLINQFIYTSGIGSGKTTIANVVQYIDLFRLITIPDIPSYFGVQPGKTIAFITLSKDEKKAKKVTFKDMLPVFARSPFIMDYFPPAQDVEALANNPSRYPSELRFPRDIVIFPGTGQAASVLGYNVYGGILDECNDMQVVEGSKKETLKNYYDAAEASSREILERMNSRFPWKTLHREEKKHGILTAIGQARYPNSYTERKIQEHELLGSESTIFYVKIPRWEAQPAERFSRETFHFDVTNKRVIEFFKPETKEIGEKSCAICSTQLTKGCYLGKDGEMVCSIDCYKESYGADIVKEKR